MTGTSWYGWVLAILLSVGPWPSERAASAAPMSGGQQRAVAAVVARVVQPLMRSRGIPGMAIGVVVDGRVAVFNVGVASKATKQPVTDDTLFEIGSVSKTFTATLATYAQVTGHLKLDDAASAVLPALRGTAFDRVSLVQLGTHTAGGLPLQVPDDVTDDDQLMRYLQHWTPTFEPGTVRRYANPSIGLLGVIAAKSLDEPYADAMARHVFAPLGLRHTWLDVPSSEASHYAQGYTTADVPIRLTSGVLAPQAYGIRSTASDLVRVIEAHLGLLDLPGDLRVAITATRTGYFQVGAMTQDLIWEQYADPVASTTLQAGNSPQMLFDPNPVARIAPPSPPRDDVFVNKTGSTNGFSAYVAFVPARKLGVVLLANKSYPIADRVAAGYAILHALSSGRRH